MIQTIFQMLKMLMFENNNEIYQDVAEYKFENDNSNIFGTFFKLFINTKCELCSYQRQVISEEEKVFAKVFNKTNIKKSTETELQKTQHCAFLAIVCFLVYANSLGGDFVHDDIPAIVTNEDALGQSSIFSVFCNDFWGMNIRDRRSHKSYRPVTVLTFR